MGETDRLVQVEAAQPLFQQGRVRHAALPVERHRGLADVFDPVEQPLTILGLDDIAQHLAKEAHLGAQFRRC